MKIAFITGGSKGLGRAFGQLLAGEGFTVHEFSRSGDGEGSIACDFADPIASARTVDAVLSRYAKDDCEDILLINNVGTLAPIGPVHDQEMDAVVANINVNFTGAVTVTALFARHFRMRSARKAIITISSGAARNGRHGWSLYSATKAGLEMFVTTFAKEQQAETLPIQSILYNPGVMETGMQTEIRSTDPTRFPERQRFIDLKAAGKLADPAQVAAFAYAHYLNNREVFSFLQYTV